MYVMDRNYRGFGQDEEEPNSTPPSDDSSDNEPNWFQQLIGSDAVKGIIKAGTDVAAARLGPKATVTHAGQIQGNKTPGSSSLTPATMGALALVGLGAVYYFTHHRR